MWLFAGSLRSGKRAAAIMSLIQSARMNGYLTQQAPSGALLNAIPLHSKAATL